MTKATTYKAVLAGAVAAVSVLGGWGPQPVGVAQASNGSGAGQAPVMPVALTLPHLAIAPGRGDLGYLPASEGVSSTGQFTYSVPLEVPAGRAGMQPSLALNYDSGSGNGIAGVGWSLSGVSSITRCAQTLATNGVVHGVHYTDFTTTPEARRDRLCLGGQQLIAVSGGYGQDQTQYRTEADSNARIVSTQDPQNAANLIFTVTTQEGRILTYSAVQATQMQTGLNAASPTGFNGAVFWALTREEDRMGNAIVYGYTTKTEHQSLLWGAAYAEQNQWLLTSITYTVSGSDTGHRQVLLSYEDRPDREFRFGGGIGTALFQRLKTVTMWAPDPATTVPVWEYVLDYNAQPSSFSHRSLLSSIQRCALNASDQVTSCTWKKGFNWSEAPATPVFSGNWQKLTSLGEYPVGGLIRPALGKNPAVPPIPLDPLINSQGQHYTDGSPLNTPVLGYWPDNPPMLTVLDVDGDGKDDVLFQGGGPGTPNVFLLKTPPTTPTSSTAVLTTLLPMNVGAYQPSSDPVSGNRQALGSVVPIDMDGDGSSEIFVTQATVNSDQTAVTCQNKALHWQDAAHGFVDVGLNLPTYGCRNPFSAYQSHQFLDLNGDHLLDHLQANQANFAPDGGPLGVSAGNSGLTVVAGPWNSAQLNNDEGGVYGQSGLSPTAPPPGDIYAACPTYVVDFSGDGIGQLFGQGGYLVANATSVDGQTDYTNGAIFCGNKSADGTQTQLDTYDPITQTWQAAPTEQDPANSATIVYNPHNPIIFGARYWGDKSDPNASEPNVPGIEGLGTTPGLIFGDFNGDGLEDVIEPDQDPAQAKNGVFWLRWNTGNGFGPRVALGSQVWAHANAEADPNVNGFQNNPQVAYIEPTYYKVYVSDINHDGRADLVVFSNYFGPMITLMLSNGDGTFTTTSVPDAQAVGGAADPGLITADGYVTGTIGDFNGDGYMDLLRLEPDDGSVDGHVHQAIPDSNPNKDPVAQSTLQVMTQTPVIADRVTAVFDGDMLWPRTAVTYAVPASDKPEAVVPCSYPQHCERHGSPVVRQVDSYTPLADPTDIQLLHPHSVFYSYEDPVSDLSGRGYLGYRKVRVWDPTQLSQTTTVYDNRSPAPAMSVYPGAQRPQTITTITALPSPSTPQQLPKLPASGVGAVKSNARVVQSTYTYEQVLTNGDKTYVVRPQQQVTREWEQAIQMVASVLDPSDPTSDYMWGVSVPAQPLRERTTTYDVFDDYGNLTHSTHAITGGTRTVMVSTYDNLVPNWQMGLLRSSRVTVTETDPLLGTAADPNAASVTTQMGYDYDAQGQLQTVHTYQVPTSDAAGVEISTTTMTRDGYGLITGVTTQAAGPDQQPTTRQTRIEYDALWPGQPDERIFPSQTWVPQPAGNWQPSSWTVIQPAYGVVSATMDANGVQSQATYDDQGRLVLAQADGQAPLMQSYAGRPDQGAQGPVLNGLVVTSRQGGQTVTASSDAGGHLLGSTHLDMNGVVTQDGKITYDLLGRAVTISRPYQGATPAYQTSMLYDGLGRTVKSVGPDGTTHWAAPTFFTTTSTDANGHQKRLTGDINGRIVASAQLKDPAGSTWITTQYHYAAGGLMDRITDPMGNVESTLYDTLGRTINHHSADTGTTTNVQYDGFGELLSSTHAESGTTTTYGYDGLGRMTGWSSTDGATSATMTYDTQAHGLGKLAKTVSSDNVTASYNYDPVGRIVEVDQAIKGSDHVYVMKKSYDGEGRVSTLAYPPAGHNLHPGVTVQYVYGPTEYLNELDYQTASLTDGTVGPLQPLWKVQTRTVDDALQSGQLGKQLAQVQNTYLAATGQLQHTRTTPYTSSAPVFDLSYQYYPNGLVQSRIDAVNGRSEVYGYDGLSRLTAWQLNTCASVPCTPASNNGGTQSYAYDDTGNLTQVQYTAPMSTIATPIQTNAYGGGGALGGPHALNGQTTAGSTPGSVAYTYDTHGRQIGGGNRTLAYNAYNLPHSVTQNGTTWQLIYDAQGQRVGKMVSSAGTNESTVYMGGVYEHRTTVAGIEDVYTVPGLAQITLSSITGTASTQYLLSDSLGSVSTVLNDTTGTVATAFFYEPFGKRIQANGTAFINLPGEVHNGFTGQEHDDAFGLINFRGRMYDPLLKRFLTPDPHVTSPLSGQSWNPYSYVNNSPLNFTDPSGFDPEPAALEVWAYSDKSEPSASAAPSSTPLPTPALPFLTWGPGVTSLPAGGTPAQTGNAPGNGVVPIPGDPEPDAKNSNDTANPETSAEKRKERSDKILQQLDPLIKASPTLKALTRQILALGVTIDQVKLPGKRYGSTNTNKRQISINDKLSPVQAAINLGHESTHMINAVNKYDWNTNLHVLPRDAFVEDSLEDEAEALRTGLEVLADLMRSAKIPREQFTDNSSAFHITSMGAPQDAMPSTQDFYVYASSLWGGKDFDIESTRSLAEKAVHDVMAPAEPRGQKYAREAGLNWDEVNDSIFR